MRDALRTARDSGISTQTIAEEAGIPVNTLTMMMSPSSARLLPKPAEKAKAWLDRHPEITVAPPAPVPPPTEDEAKASQAHRVAGPARLRSSQGQVRPEIIGGRPPAADKDGNMARKRGFGLRAYLE